MEMLEQVGRGAHSTVYKLTYCAAPATARTYIAVKQLCPHSARELRDSPRMQREFAVARLCFVHDGLVRMLALDAALGIMAMEFVAGGSLADALAREGPLRQAALAPLVAQVLAALAVLHAHGCPHRDLKPANILLVGDGDRQDIDTSRIKLCDWIGREQEAAALAAGKPVGTPLFMAPEVAGCPHTHCVQSDTWALGCTIVNLLSGRLPWQDADALGWTNEFMAMWKTAHGHAPPHDSALWSEPLQSFVSQCFTHQASARPSALDLRQHVWVRTEGANGRETGILNA